MRYAKAIVIFILFVPMMMLIGFAALFGAAIRALNNKPQIDEEEQSPQRRHPKPADRYWWT
jgi:hypothetical protein